MDDKFKYRQLLMFVSDAEGEEWNTSDRIRKLTAEFLSLLRKEFYTKEDFERFINEELNHFLISA